ncbi:hypothetical protein Tdes44962_MAKER05911 [Teratosphaeria destructans]|uniref:Uncharacterized protein n=1 Tax=Teratosphaeria destructans TaxID=418781 RepID=A0A9W7SIW1_9PEZI|nr:hypothetical protein Tdes44962_MAKER05911 [Teratosphaeria destructans]
MSSEQTLPTFSTSDLRSTAQDYKRDAARKHKWALGTAPMAAGRQQGGKPRPHRPNETAFNARRREAKSAAVASIQSSSKIARKHDMLEGNQDRVSSSDEATNSSCNSSDLEDQVFSPTPAEAGALYSFSARGPSHGSQILNAALAKAVERFEERETVKLVNNEYEVLDDEGESVGLTPAKRKGKSYAKVVKEVAPSGGDIDEDEYEIV